MRFDNSEIAFSHLDDSALKRASLLFSLMANRFLGSIGPKFIHLMLTLRLPIISIVKRTLFFQFCGGESIEGTRETLRTLSSRGLGAILDYSVEGASNTATFNAVMKEILATIELAQSSEGIPFCVFKVSALAPVRLLEKVQSKETLSSEEATEYEMVKARVLELCQKAFSSKVRIFIDAEESWIQEPIDQLAESMMERFNKVEAVVFTTVQMYRVDRFEYVVKLFESAKAQGYKVGLKIVRGAYMEKERERAARNHQVSPIHIDQYSTDRDYNLALEFCTHHRDIFRICAGTHNEFSTLKLVKLMEVNGIKNSDPNFYFAQLLGMSDHISGALAKSGYNTAKYVPYGPVREVLPYLFRRAEENSSIAGQSGRELSLLKKEIVRRRMKTLGK
jgi:proline dehydrogenase